jgi:Acetyltransferase (GNAT) domain
MSDILNNLSEKVPGAPIAFDAIMTLRDMAFEASCAPLEAECLPAQEALVLYAPQLRELSRRALVPNLIHDASILAPALKHLDDQTLNLEILLAWQPISENPEKNANHKRLVGWMVVHRARAIPGIGFSYLRNWHHLYSYMGHPIVDRDNSKAALSALFDQALAHKGTSGRLMMSNVPGEGPIYDAISNVISDKNLLVCEFDRHHRAAMMTTLGGEEYLKSAASNKKRKEFRRLKNRLADQGDLRFEACRAVADIAPWVEDFIELEVAGWKGRKQTAFGNRHDWAAFMKASTINLAENEQCKIWRLTLDNKTIAITIAHHAEHRAWLTKIAYDEAYAKYSPGVLLILEVSKALADDPLITEVDSLATPDHPMINHLWREKISTTDILIANTHPFARLGFAATCQLIAARRLVRAKAKSIYYRFLKGAKR